MSILTFVDEKNKNEYFSDNLGFLDYKVNISFVTEKLPYYHIFSNLWYKSGSVLKTAS